MKMLAILLLTVLVGACSYSERRYVRDDGYRGSGQVSGQGAGQDRQVICHKGKKTMELPASAVDAHLGHGDRRGPC